LSATNYDIIIKKLDAFINKYYKNLMIKGVIYLLLVSLSLFILLAISEYFIHFSTVSRTIIFYLYIVVFLTLLGRFILAPFLSLFRLSKHLDYQDASKIIGRHFPEIRDKLSNILQLRQLEDMSSEHRALIEAGIAQKAEKIRPFPLLKVITFKANTKYLKYLAVPVFLLLITWLIKPTFVEEPTKHLVQYNTEFKAPQPFKIHILNENLQAFQKDDYTLNIEVSGEELPSKLFISFMNSRYLMVQKSGNHFSYTFKNLRTSLQFTMTDAAEFISDSYTLEVFPKASFSAFQVQIKPPKYTQIPANAVSNIGDLKVPEGSIISWNMETRNCEDIKMIKGTEKIQKKILENQYRFNDTLARSTDYHMFVSNKYLQNSDSISWSVHILKDEYPRIDVKTIRDTNNSHLLYFNGFIDDDYGFTKLQMVMELGGAKRIENIAINKQTRPQSFYYYLNLDDFDTIRGSDMTYYFRVFDNDAWNGAKSSRSLKQIYHFDSDKELVEKRDEQSDSLKTDMLESLQELRKLNKSIKEFKKELVNKEMLSWDDQKKMENLMKQQEDLQKKIDDFKNKNKDLKNQSEDINQNERILEKQEKLEELFDQVMDEETKQKMEELRKLMEEMNKENSQDLLDKMEMNSQELEDQLDRNLELFKQLEFEIRLEENINKMKELAKKQKDLAKESQKSKKDQAKDIAQKQDSINKAFDELKKDLEKLDSLNKALEEPNKFDKQEESQKKIDSLQSESQKNLEKQKMKEAAQKMENAAEEMENMASEMQAQMDQNSQEQQGEDMEALRAILDKLIKLSFLQENLIDSLSGLENIDPRYNELVRRQYGMESKFQSVRDSLASLAKRQPAVQPYVLKEFNKIDYRLKSTTDFLEAHKTAEAVREQQFIMTSFNQLALMLNEALKQMQQSMKNMMQGNSGKKGQSCPKPGGGKPSPGSMKSLQQQLNQQMKALQKQQKEGRKKGQKGSKGQGMSEKFARMAAQQAKIRRMMEDYQQQMLDETGKKTGGLDATIKDMEKTEKDLVNKLINQETIKRQANILTRLLKSEKAERQREKEKKRQSEVGKNIKRSNPKEFLKYKEVKEKELILMKTIPLDFNSYYKKKVDEYFYKFENIDDDVEK